MEPTTLQMTDDERAKLEQLKKLPENWVIEDKDLLKEIREKAAADQAPTPNSATEERAPVEEISKAMERVSRGNERVEPPPKYCTSCGRTLVLVYVTGDELDERTGQQVVYERERCPNTSCVRGCEENGGHQYKGWFSKKCKRCGDLLNCSYYDD